MELFIKVVFFIIHGSFPFVVFPLSNNLSPDSFGVDNRFYGFGNSRGHDDIIL